MGRDNVLNRFSAAGGGGKPSPAWNQSEPSINHAESTQVKAESETIAIRRNNPAPVEDAPVDLEPGPDQADSGRMAPGGVEKYPLEKPRVRNVHVNSVSPPNTISLHPTENSASRAFA